MRWLQDQHDLESAGQIVTIEWILSNDFSFCSQGRE